MVTAVDGSGWERRLRSTVVTGAQGGTTTRDVELVHDHDTHTTTRTVDIDREAPQ